MDSFQKRMMTYVKYGISIRTTSAADGVEYYVVTINFNPKWNVVKPSDETVNCVSQTESGAYVYFTEVNNGIDTVFDAIDDTINYNEDVEKKITLLRQKISELQELFANETYENLQRLTFVIQDGAKKRGRKPKQQEVVEEVKEEVKDDITNCDNIQEIPVETVEEETPKVDTNTGENVEEASDIDAKIAAALGKNKI